MVAERKIRCDCGTHMQPKVVDFDGFNTEGMVCPKCGFTTLTAQQAQKYAQLKQLHSIIDAERKIIRVGNSMGITLPEQLKSFGLKVGRKVKTTALDENSFKMEIC